MGRTNANSTSVWPRSVRNLFFAAVKVIFNSLVFRSGKGGWAPPFSGGAHPIGTV
jgi:hypothetical protein